MDDAGVTEIRKAVPDDATGIVRVQIDSYQSAYVGILPQLYLERFSNENRPKAGMNSLSPNRMTSSVSLKGTLKILLDWVAQG